MSVLTHEVAKALRDRVNANDPLELIRATEAAVLSKLAGVSVVPVAWLHDGALFHQAVGWKGSPSFLPIYPPEAIAAARVAALEEAAQRVEILSLGKSRVVFEGVADAIRALIGGKHAD